MLTSTAAIALLACSMAVAAPSAPPESTTAPASPDRCIAFVTTNLAKGNGNWYTYMRFADTRMLVKPGDVLSYRILLDPHIPEPKGGIDADFEGGGDALRELKLLDDHGVRAHGDGDLSAALGKWLTRKIDISPAKGRTIVSWNLAEEGDKDGRYAQFIDDVVVQHADGSRTVIYENGPPPTHALLINNGYTNKPVCVAIDSSMVRAESMDKTILEAENLGRRLQALNDTRREAALIRQFAERDADEHMKQHAAEADAAIKQAERAGATAEEIEAALHTARTALTHAHPAMEKFTGHLVGHAHIDLQWLWEWQEGIVFTHDTFAQVVRFMDEFPGFTFSQSSSCLYQAVEQHYPALFADIQKKIKAGQWELVGGRVCEGDTNMIGEESSARQFLYGQRYFREKFGTTAVVGWEPDTFGHTFQMPQILRLGGCQYYYFCRGGKNKPLFWWEGLDGSRVLAFDEPATGSWYNSDLSYKQFEEMLEFNKTTGSKDMLWVYGVGNHGGGPTREHIQWALEQMKSGSAPNIRFSTASEFFKKLSTYDLTKIPVIHEELNPVFDGCYTSHSEIKQLNRQAESLTTTAEAVAAVASLSTFAYPRADFRRNWEDICFNHHHDTLPGSGIHAPYERTKTSLGRVIADDRDIITRAMESLVVQVKPNAGGVSIMVFNPSGWTRSGWVETYLVKSGWDHSDAPDATHCIAHAPDGSASPVTLIDAPSHLVRFMAKDVPAFGYRVFRLTRGEPAREHLDIRDDGATIETDRLIVEFDRAHGHIKRLFDKLAKRELCATGLGRLEAHWEAVQGMSAWTLGKIEKVDAIPPTAAAFAHGVDFAEATFTYALPSWNALGTESRIVQRFRVNAESDQITCDVDCQWNGIGSKLSPNALLRVAFDVRADKSVATYHVPFGALSRPAEGREFPALQWADISDDSGGIAVLNDSKHGFAATGSRLTMSLIRASFEPDPVPNPGAHHWRYAIAPHAGDWRNAGLAQRAGAFNQPLIAATVPYDAAGAAPLQWGLLSEQTSGVVATGLKRTEEGDDLAIRFYEPIGRAATPTIKPTEAVQLAGEVNFIEDALQPAGSSTPLRDLKFHPFEIKTLRLQPKRSTLDTNR